MNINFEKETYSVDYDVVNKIIELKEQIGKSYLFNVWSYKTSL